MSKKRLLERWTIETNLQAPAGTIIGTTYTTPHYYTTITQFKHFKERVPAQWQKLLPVRFDALDGVNAHTHTLGSFHDERSTVFHMQYVFDHVCTLPAVKVASNPDGSDKSELQQRQPLPRCAFRCWPSDLRASASSSSLGALLQYLPQTQNRKAARQRLPCCCRLLRAPRPAAPSSRSSP
mmetsp:Transcript_57269/g.48374  ORF Transcript_57269/g.48374 Transcript_57269/m.48374 type:complete len:181 (+) Transcript_57269:71-613(+)